MEGLKVKERDIVVPGEIIAEGMGFLPSKHVYREENRLIASRTGVIEIEGNVVKLMPLSGIYLPKFGDTIIGEVGDILMSGWRLETYSPYSAVLSLKEATSAYIPKGADLTKYFAIGEHVATKVVNVTSQNLVDVTMNGPGLRKLKDGRLIRVNPYKVPRIIGKSGSMISMIKEATNCRIVVGQNGVIWIEGSPKDELVAVKAIEYIEREAHTSGLTERVSALLGVASPKNDRVAKAPRLR